MAKPIDDAFKELIQSSSLAFIQNQLGEKFDSIEPSATELVKVVREADFVYKITQKKVEKILHLEVQTAHDPDMHARMLLYVGLLFKKHYLPIKQMVLYLGESPMKVSNIKPMVDNIQMEYFQYKYKLINIVDTNYSVFLRKKETLPLAILGKYDPKNVLKVIRDIFLGAKEFLRTKKEFLELKYNLVVLSKLRKFGENPDVTEDLISNIKEIQFMFKDIDYTDVSIYKESELKTKLKLAKAFLLEKSPVAQVIKCTGLSKEQVEALAKEIKIKK